MEHTQTLSIWDPLAYLSQSELSYIDNQFDIILQSAACLVFWIGLPLSLVQRWVDQNDLRTLIGAMSSLFDPSNSKSPRLGKTKKGWFKYMKGASGRFAEYVCRGRRAIVLMNPLSDIYSTRTCSIFRHLEELILTEAFGGSRAIRIDYVHSKVAGTADFHYQMWPVNRSNE